MQGEGFPSKSKVPGPEKSGLFCLPHAPNALEVFSILGCRSRSGPYGALGHPPGPALPLGGPHRGRAKFSALSSGLSGSLHSD